MSAKLTGRTACWIPHSLGPRECVYPAGVSRLDAVLEMELQKVRRRACHRRRVLAEVVECET